jgi:hypothetical protein
MHGRYFVRFSFSPFNEPFYLTWDNSQPIFIEDFMVSHMIITIIFSLVDGSGTVVEPFL